MTFLRPFVVCTQEQNGSPYYSGHRSSMQITVSSRKIVSWDQKFRYHKKVMSQFSLYTYLFKQMVEVVTVTVIGYSVVLVSADQLTALFICSVEFPKLNERHRFHCITHFMAQSSIESTTEEDIVWLVSRWKGSKSKLIYWKPVDVEPWDLIGISWTRKDNAERTIIAIPCITIWVSFDWRQANLVTEISVSVTALYVKKVFCVMYIEKQTNLHLNS